MVFSCQLADNPLDRPFCCPFNFPWKLSVAVIRGNFALIAASFCPFNIIFFTAVFYSFFFKIPLISFGCPYFSAFFAYGVKWQNYFYFAAGLLKS